MIDKLCDEEFSFIYSLLEEERERIREQVKNSNMDTITNKRKEEIDRARRIISNCEKKIRKYLKYDNKEIVRTNKGFETKKMEKVRLR